MHSFDEKISQYYDKEMNSSTLLSYEAKMCSSIYSREYINDKCFEYYKITCSMQHTKNALENKAKKAFEVYINSKSKVLFNINSVLFKRIKKVLRNGFLNFLRHNSK